jgi:hypothetical protein
MRTSTLIAVAFFVWAAAVMSAGLKPGPTDVGPTVMSAGLKPGTTFVGPTFRSAGITARAQQAPVLTGEYKPPPAPEQPLPYSHKTHLAQELKCADCHSTAETEDLATFPTTGICMGCHTNVKTDSPNIQKLAQYDQKNEEIPWRRVYRLPEFVYWSHKRHVTDAKITCDTCHGNVAQMDVMQKVKDISMAACIECHTKSSAPARCDTCHETQ